MKHLLTVILTAGICYAEPVKVHIAAVKGEKAISCADVTQLFEEAKGAFSDIGIDLELVQLDCLKRQRPRGTLQNRATQLIKYIRVLNRLNPRNDTLHIAVTPPLKDGGKFYIAGFSIGTCRYPITYAAGVVNAEYTSAEGEDRWGASVVALQHELGHLLGAKHDPLGTLAIMEPGAARFNQRLEFSDYSEEWMLGCVDRREPYVPGFYN